MVRACSARRGSGRDGSGLRSPPTVIRYWYEPNHSRESMMTSTAPTNFDADIEEAVARGRISFRSAQRRQQARDTARGHGADRTRIGQGESAYTGLTLTRTVIIDGVIRPNN